MGQIISLDELSCVLQKHRDKGKRIVLCHGVFDLLHIGHIRYLSQAKDLGDILVTTCTPDRYVDKGPGRPCFTERLRAEALASLKCVDYVAINNWETAEETLRLLRPHLYVKGAEFKNLEDPTGKIGREAKVAQEVGAQLKFVSDIVFSSSNLINRFLSNLSKETREYLDVFRKRHTTSELCSYLDQLKDLTVLLVGDAIIDEYIYCSPLGASSKDPILALLHQSQERFAGGAAAIANHLAQHVKKVIWHTVLGDAENDDDFFRQRLAPNVELCPCIRKGAPTVKKTRIVDSYSFQKTLEIYEMDRDPLPKTLNEKFKQQINEDISSADICLAADFGNGCIMPDVAQFLSRPFPFLAVNTQANAGNRGYHTIGRYTKADFVSLAVHEINLEFRNVSLNKIAMMKRLQKKLSANYVLLTEGRSGCSLLAGHDSQSAPSFTSNVVDRVGAGDALFSLTAICAYKNVPPDVIVFFGNIAGSLAVETIGNAKAVSNDAIVKYITAIMK